MAQGKTYTPEEIAEIRKKVERTLSYSRPLISVEKIRPISIEEAKKMLKNYRKFHKEIFKKRGRKYPLVKK
jgi:hypothetical protein